MGIYAFDVDGVLVDCRKRLEYAVEVSKYRGRDLWEVFFSDELMEWDTPREVGIELIRDRASKGGVIIVSGRPSRLRRLTEEQIVTLSGVRPLKLYLRRDGDRRPAPKVKAELLEKAIKDGFEVIEFHDDSEEVLRELKRLFPWIRFYLHSNGFFTPY